MRAAWTEIDGGVAREHLVLDLGDGDFSFSWPVIVLRATGQRGGVWVPGRAPLAAPGVALGTQADLSNVSGRYTG